MDDIIDEENLKPEPSNKLLKEELQRQHRKDIFKEIIEARNKKDLPAQVEALEKFFDFEKTKPRLEVLQDTNYDNVVKKKEN